MNEFHLLLDLFYINQVMGTQQSKAILGTPQQYEIQQQKRKQQHKAIKQSQSFFKIQPCYYPHSLMQSNPQYQKNKYYNRCTRKHDKHHDSFNICSQCQSFPQKIRKRNKIFYQKNTYKPQKPQPQTYLYEGQNYKEKQVLAPGPQVPGFYNGFSLPVDKYYKQKIQVNDNIESIKGSIYRQENKEIQQSIYEERNQKNSHHHHQMQQIEIDYDGRQQILRF